ncbi:MAG: hypothetical protein R2715_21570 [Ilumatobacteraceae bacterium]
MTDHHSTDVEEAADQQSSGEAKHLSRRGWLGMAGLGAGVAGAALISRPGAAAANDGDNVSVGGTFTGDTATSFENTTTTAAIAGPANAIKGVINSATNGSHSILGTTAGDGHAVAGVASKLDNARGATWGRHLGAGAGVEGENQATDIAIAGPANGVKGIITEASNGSHAVLGITAGGGHAVAGDIEATAPNTVAATWGRHKGTGAGIGGISVSGYGGEFVGGKASVRLIPSTGVAAGPPTDTGHLRGELYVDGVGDIYYNVSDGSNFTKLNSQGGTNLFVDPERGFDSRSPSNKFGAGETRKVNLAATTSLPTGARGAVINLTVSDTDGYGYITLYNGDSTTRPDTSAVNWSAVGTVVANSMPVALGADGSVNVFAFGATHVIIDVIGYIL